MKLAHLHHLCKKPYWFRPIKRQVWEGVEIREVSCDILLSFKLDHYAPVVGRMKERRKAVQRARLASV